MAINMNGINAGLNNVSYLNQAQSPKSAKDKTDISQITEDSKPVEQSVNQKPPTLPVEKPASFTNKDKTEGITDSDKTDRKSMEEVASLMSIIESSRKISGVNAFELLSKIIPSQPESQSQLSLDGTGIKNPQEQAIASKLLREFKQIDTDNDGLISFAEAVTFINRS